MKISLWISAIVLCVARIVFSSSIQVGTVLFSKTDLAKRCWSESDKSLLRARFIMQDVLPDPECIDFSKPGAVMILIEYFQFCYEIINRSCYGKVQNLMFLALSDALGGYLRAYVLPLTKRAFYAGQVKYSEAKKLFQLYDEIKAFLKTNGMGWAKPAKLCPTKFRPKPLSVNTAGKEEACDQLYIIEIKPQQSILDPNLVMEDFHKPEEKDTKKLHGDTNKVSKRNIGVESLKEFEGLHSSKVVRSNFSRDSRFADRAPFLEKAGNFKERLKYYQKLRKQSAKHNLLKNTNNKFVGNETNVRTQKEVKEDRKYRCECEGHNNKPTESSKKTFIPLPVLDDSTTPHTIAVPFKNHPLRSLQNPSSAFLLERYYSTVVKCLVSKRNSNSDIKTFNAEFHTWLVTEVLPHLSDEEWYPAFGGVLRILETIKKIGIRPSLEDSKFKDIAFIFSKTFNMDGGHKCTQKGKERVRDVGDFENQATTVKRNYVFAILIISIIWVLSFCACAFYLQAKKSGRNYAPCAKDNTKEKFVNLEFLIRFFKRKEESQEDLEECEDENEIDEAEPSHQWGRSYSSANVRGSGKYGYEEKSIKEDSRAKNDKITGQLVVTGGGDVPAFIISNVETAQPRLDTSVRPVRTGQTPFIRFEKVGQSNVEIPPESKPKNKNTSPAKNFYEKVETIWKKPSAKFQKITKKDKKGDSKLNKDSQGPKKMAEKKKKEFFRATASEPCSISVEDEKKDYSTEKRSTSCSYSGTCSQSNETTTFSSSNIQGDEKCSSDTMKFFRKVIAKHKPLMKSSVQETTEDSNSEGDTSYSSETDY